MEYSYTQDWGGTTLTITYPDKVTYQTAFDVTFSVDSSTMGDYDAIAFLSTLGMSQTVDLSQATWDYSFVSGDSGWNYSYTGVLGDSTTPWSATDTQYIINFADPLTSSYTWLWGYYGDMVTWSINGIIIEADTTFTLRLDDEGYTGGPIAPAFIVLDPPALAVPGGEDPPPDTVESSVDYTLAAGVKNLVLTGSDDISGTGNELDNVITGNAGDNVLDGAAGADTLIGDAGDDTYLYNQGDGLDVLVDSAGIDQLSFGSGLSLDNVVIRVTSVDGGYMAQLRVLGADGCEQADQGVDFAVVLDTSGEYVSPIETFRFADGSISTFDDVLIKTRITQGTPGTPDITTGRNDDVITAGPGGNLIHSGSGNDVVYAGGNRDVVYGEGGDDFLFGANSNDLLDGGAGFDVLQGGNGNDLLRQQDGNSALLGEIGYDSITGGLGDDFIAGGQHDDTIVTGAGHNIVAFNRNDRNDIILSSAGAVNTLSLGGGIRGSDLTLSAVGDDLVLSAGHNDSITFTAWYADPANRNFVTLQLIEEAAADFSPASPDPLFNRSIQSFDFAALVGEFDQARSANPNLSNWSLMNGLLDAHLEGSDSAALGGDLAYQYGLRGDLGGLNLCAAQETLRGENFGSQAQAVHQWSSMNAGEVRLG